jgi:RND family efflux transporter MFP subunit
MPARGRPTGVSAARAAWSRLGALLTVAAVLMSSGCREAPKPAGPIPVQVTPVIQRDVPIYREWIGTTVGYVTVQIRPKVSGYLVSQDYKEGRPVKTGDLLFRIDPRQYQNAFDQARGKLEQSQAQLGQARSQLAQNLFEVEQAKAQVRQAESDLAKAEANQVKTKLEVERYTPLLARGAISQQLLDNTIQNNLANEATVRAERANLDKARANLERTQAGVDKARADVAAAEAAIVQSQAALDEAQLNLGWTKIQSPIDGVAGIRKADIGDLVGASTILTTVASIDPIYVQFDLTEQQYLRWREARGLESPDRFKIELILANGRAFAQTGTAEILGLDVSATTGTIPVRALFRNPGNVLRPGQYARVRVAVYVAKGALLVPQQAVRDTQGLLQVGVVGPDDTVSLRTIDAGERVGSLWIIDRGLQPGQRVIVEGLEKVKTGDKVAPTAVPAETSKDDTARPGTPAASPPAPSAGKNPPK